MAISKKKKNVYVEIRTRDPDPESRTYTRSRSLGSAMVPLLILYFNFWPGWADTPAVRSSMPDFYNKMKDRLRTVEQGADTLVWLSLAKSVTEDPKNQGGQFFQDREPVSKHLPLAWTRSSEAEDLKLMSVLDEFSAKFEP